MDVKKGAHMDESRLCGSCHTVIVPALPVGYQGDDPLNDTSLRIAYEQTTYWEWRNSWYETERTQDGLNCQGCHMTPHGGEQRIARCQWNCGSDQKINPKNRKRPHPSGQAIDIPEGSSSSGPRSKTPQTQRFQRFRRLTGFI